MYLYHLIQILHKNHPIIQKQVKDARLIIVSLRDHFHVSLRDPFMIISFQGMNKKKEKNKIIYVLKKLKDFYYFNHLMHIDTEFIISRLPIFINLTNNLVFIILYTRYDIKLNLLVSFNSHSYLYVQSPMKEAQSTLFACLGLFLSNKLTQQSHLDSQIFFKFIFLNHFGKCCR